MQRARQIVTRGRDHIRATLRAAGIAAGSQRDALGQLAAHTELDEAFKRVGAPGSSWGHDERAKRENEMAEASVEAAERHP